MTHFETAREGFKKIFFQLVAANVVITRAVAAEFPGPSTMATYNFIGQNLESAMGDCRKVLAGFGTVAEEIPPMTPEDLPPMANIAGLAEFIIHRVPVLLNPLELHKYPQKPGLNGGLALRSKQAVLLEIITDFLKKMHRLHRILVSEGHRLDITEAQRQAAYDASKRTWLQGQIKLTDVTIAEGEKFIAEAKTARALLVTQLAEVGQSTLALPGAEPEKVTALPPNFTEAALAAAAPEGQILEFPVPPPAQNQPPPLGRV